MHIKPLARVGEERYSTRTRPLESGTSTTIVRVVRGADRAGRAFTTRTVEPAGREGEKWIV